ncbi:MAG: hypothetical protein K6C41_05980 [Lachnospiraceae bacterium]|nr:hypothetical protein [Lachnospiraceae bacterium]
MDRMKKMVKKALVLSIALLLFAVYTALPITAGATPAGAVTTIGVSKKELKVGESLSVTVTCTAEASITLKFSASRLKLDDPGSGTADGNSVTFKAARNTIRFTATAAGKADLIVASADATVTGSSASVTITDAGGQGTSAPASSATPETPASSATSQTPASSAAPASSASPAPAAADLPKGQVSSNGRIYAVSERYSDASIPAGFSKTQLSIAKGSYEELSNGQITLVFLKLMNGDTMENEGHFFCYDEATGTFSPLIPYLNSYVIPLSEAAIPEGEKLSTSLFSKAELTYNSGGVLAIQDTYVLKDDPGAFHYIYGKTFDGQTTWYSYDTAVANLQRADTALLKDYQSKAKGTGEGVGPSSGTSSEGASSQTPASTTEKSSGFSFQKVLLIIIIFIVIFIILVIISMIPRRRRDDDDDDDEYDDDEDFERSIVKKEYADDEEEDDDDLPYGDDEDEDDDEDDDGDEEETPKKAPEKTRVMPDVSDNGLRKILSSDSIIASGQETKEEPATPPAAKSPVNKPKSEGGGDSTPSGGSNVGVMDLNDI